MTHNREQVTECAYLGRISAGELEASQASEPSKSNVQNSGMSELSAEAGSGPDGCERSPPALGRWSGGGVPLRKTDGSLRRGEEKTPADADRTPGSCDADAGALARGFTLISANS